MTTINDFFTLYPTAASDKDRYLMLSLYSKQAVIFDMWDKGFIADSSEWEKNIHDWFDSSGEEKIKVGFEMINIHESGTVGLASALIRFSAISADENILRSMKNRITLGFLKDEEGWKVVHQHISAPIDSNGKVMFEI